MRWKTALHGMECRASGFLRLFYPVFLCLCGGDTRGFFVQKDVYKRQIQYIEQHLREELTIRDIAQQAALSPFYFQKGFAMLCGMTVGDYIRQRRLSVAGLEVLTTDQMCIRDRNNGVAYAIDRWILPEQ